MSVIRADEGVTFDSHGTSFDSFVRSSDLAAWQLRVEPGTQGVAHRPSHEEVFLVLEGSLRVTLDGTVSELRPRDVMHVPADAELKVDGGPAGATAWVTTTSGLEAVSSDGTRIRPPWAQSES